MAVAAKTKEPKTVPPKRASAARADSNGDRAPVQAIRIVVVDDHPLFRHGLIQLLDSDDGFAVCGEASSAGEALEVIRKSKPHLVIADLVLQGPNGIELTKSIVVEYQLLPVLILYMHDESLYAIRSLWSGSHWYV